jgi:hypothetical protein
LLIRNVTATTESGECDINWDGKDTWRVRLFLEITEMFFRVISSLTFEPHVLVENIPQYINIFMYI